jgi:hypothetical protein
MVLQGRQKNCGYASAFRAFILTVSIVCKYWLDHPGTYQRGYVVFWSNAGSQ